MDKAMYDGLVNSLQEAIAYTQGKKVGKAHRVEIPATLDVKAIRKKLKLSRDGFSREFGVSVKTLQHWEQGSRKPRGPARVLLLLLQRAPKEISNILHQQAF